MTTSLKRKRINAISIIETLLITSAIAVKHPVNSLEDLTNVILMHASQPSSKVIGDDLTIRQVKASEAVLRSIGFGRAHCTSSITEGERLRVGHRSLHQQSPTASCTLMDPRHRGEERITSDTKPGCSAFNGLKRSPCGLSVLQGHRHCVSHFASAVAMLKQPTEASSARQLAFLKCLAADPHSHIWSCDVEFTNFGKSSTVPWSICVRSLRDDSLVINCTIDYEGKAFDHLMEVVHQYREDGYEMPDSIRSRL
jgi:hypothetical protein